MISRSLIILFLLLIGISFVSSQGCTAFLNCDDCIAEDGCGWCESTGQCLPGNSLGPGGIKANCTEWFFDTCLIEPCYRFTTCQRCVQDPFCGWCNTTSKCQEGDKIGPIFGTCLFFWYKTVAQCPQPSSAVPSTVGFRSTTGLVNPPPATSFSSNATRSLTLSPFQSPTFSLFLSSSHASSLHPSLFILFSILIAILILLVSSSLSI